MPYKLQFLPTALKEWKKLDGSIRNQLKKKLTALSLTSASPLMPSAATRYPDYALP
ncbi:hypothetical protein GKODMF_01860 [Candidatus Electrothrix gigas]